MSMDALDKYFKGLTAHEFEEHVQIEADLNKAASEGFSKQTALKFVLTTVSIRKLHPGARIDVILDTALGYGLDQVLSKLREEKQLGAPKRKAKPGGRLVK